MKKIKKIFLVLLCLFLLTGCNFLEDDSMENIDIYTTIYPINYLIKYLYGDNSTIHSIYPKGIDISNYELSEKKINEYSKSELFIFNSLDIDRDYAVKMLNYNKELKLIDVSLGMTLKNSLYELWLNPYNYLMMAKNVHDGLYQYIDNPYLIKSIEKNYESLKYEISNLDALIKENTTDANYNTIVTDNNALLFLEKYGIKVISLEENENLEQVKIAEAKKLANEGKIKYIYSFNENTNKTCQSLINEYNLTLIKLNSMNSIDGDITSPNEDYLTIMNNNIELISKELEK